VPNFIHNHHVKEAFTSTCKQGILTTGKTNAIMKNQQSVWFLALTLLLGLAFSCGKKTDAASQGGTAEGSANVKLTQNGQVVTEFNATQIVAIGGGGYAVTIASPDQKHNLVLTIKGESAGTYPFITPSQVLSVSKANFLYQSYALPAASAGTVGILLPTTGEVVLKTASKTRCSGMFTGTGKNNKDGKTYTLSGTFDAPVVN